MVDTVIPMPTARPAAPVYQSRVFMGDRGELSPDLKDQRRIALDFNAGGGRGVEIIVPSDVSPEEADISEAYVTGVKQLFEDFGYGDYPIRNSDYRPGVKRSGQDNARGVRNTFHTEPFFKEDQAARAIFMNPDFQAQYANLLNSTLRTIPNSTVIAPHGVGADKGAAFEQDGQTVTEHSIGMGILELLAPTNEPSPVSDFEQADDPIGAIILAKAIPASLNDNTSPNDTLSERLLSASAPFPVTMGSLAARNPAPKPKPETQPRRSIGAMIKNLLGI